MSRTHLSDKEEEKFSRPDTPESSASDDSFHSAGENDSSPAHNGEPNQASTEDCTEEVSQSSDELLPDVPVIEPDDKEKADEFGDDKEKADEFGDDKEKADEFGEFELDPSKEEEEVDEDFIDEEHLKDLELSMTEEEKEDKKKKSLLHKDDGNTNFKAGQYEEAHSAYTAGLRLCPISFPKERSVLYANRAAAKSKLDKKKEAIKDCTSAIDLDGTYLKAILRRATLNEETEQLDEALKDFQTVIKLDPSHMEAQTAVRRLPPLIEERNEKLKEEMFGKLKDLGNMFLRPFGLSTDNFQLNQDPNSGGYNISFQQNSQSPN